MKQLEKTVHFVSEGTSIGCYDSKGNPIRYIMIGGTPYIELDKYVNRFLNIDEAAVHHKELRYCSNHRSDLFSFVKLVGVLNGTFISSNNSHYFYAERPCTHRELASFHLAMYKAQKNIIKLSEAENG